MLHQRLGVKAKIFRLGLGIQGLTLGLGPGFVSSALVNTTGSESVLNL